MYLNEIRYLKGLSVDPFPYIACVYKERLFELPELELNYALKGVDIHKVTYLSACESLDVGPDDGNISNTTTLRVVFERATESKVTPKVKEEEIYVELSDHRMYPILKVLWVPGVEMKYICKRADYFDRSILKLRFDLVMDALTGNSFSRDYRKRLKKYEGYYE